jgi:hypothetical protein
VSVFFSDVALLLLWSTDIPMSTAVNDTLASTARLSLVRPMPLRRARVRAAGKDAPAVQFVVGPDALLIGNCINFFLFALMLVYHIVPHFV